MSHAKKCEHRIALCSHISNSVFVLFHRAKPVTETKRSGVEVHGGVAVRIGAEVHGGVAVHNKAAGGKELIHGSQEKPKKIHIP